MFLSEYNFFKIFLLIIILLIVILINKCTMVDKCLDKGGRWNYQQQSCECIR